MQFAAFLCQKDEAKTKPSGIMTEGEVLGQEWIPSGDKYENFEFTKLLQQ